MNKKFILMLIFILFLTSCSKKVSYEDVKLKLENMKSYVAQAEIDIYGNKGVSHYKVVQYFKEPNLTRIETISPSFLKGKILAFDGNRYCIFQPLINQKYFIKQLKDDEAFIFLGIIDKRIFTKEGVKYSNKVIDEKQYISIKADLEESSPYRKNVELFFDKEKLLPEMMVIYDEAQNVRVNINFNEFKYNPAVDNGIFKIQ